jgi:hypothetical protein
MVSPDARRFPNPGRPPSKWPADTRIGVAWANGADARHTYTVEQLRWTRTGSDFDVGEFWKA